MLLMRFEDEEIKDIKDAQDFYEALGITEEVFGIPDIFGKSPYYYNMVLHPETDSAIMEKIRTNNDDKRAGFDWVNFSPVACGPRYEEVENTVGRICRNVLYIITPDDKIFEEFDYGKGNSRP